MDEDQTVFEQLTLSDFKKCSFIAWKIFNNYSTIMKNNSDNIKIS